MDKVLLGEAAKQATLTERSTGVPAELSLAQYGIESAWGAKLTGKNNYFGIKAIFGQAGADIITTEYYTPEELAYWGKRRKILEVGPLRLIVGGEHKVKLVDRFADYASMADAFAAHAKLLMTGSRFVGAWKTFQQTKDRPKFYHELSKAYSTNDQFDKYYTLLTSIINGARVKSALAAVKL